MAREEVLLERDGQVIHLRLHRPERRNAIGARLWDELREALAEAADAGPRVLLVSGAGGHFSTGLDLSPENPLLARVPPIVQRRDPYAARRLIEEVKSVCGLMAAFPAPTIAAIEGSCLGAGLELALACDLRVAASDATFALPEVRLGLVPDLGGTVRAARLVGPGRAALLALAGRVLRGDEAAGIGLVEVLAEPGQALAAALVLAADIVAGGPTAARGVLHLLRTAGDMDLCDALVLETEAGANALLSGEALEGLAARAAGRKPAWND